jgi:hypothetical protein
MREIPSIASGLGWASWSFAPITVSRLVEGGVPERTGNGMDETRGSLHCDAQDEAVIRSVEMTWLWE